MGKWRGGVEWLGRGRGYPGGGGEVSGKWLEKWLEKKWQGGKQRVGRG